LTEVDQQRNFPTFCLTSDACQRFLIDRSVTAIFEALRSRRFIAAVSGCEQHKLGLLCVLTTENMAYELTEQQRVGLGLIGFGIFFSFLGIILFFDRGLLALGNVLWLIGVAVLLGWYSTWRLFTNRENYKGSVSFLLGLFFIFVRWPIVGIVMELYGCFALFGGFWPSMKAVLYQIPVIGWIIQYPVLVTLRILAVHHFM
ncbi:Vesicle transport protein GOT1, partial [Linum perenne]